MNCLKIIKSTLSIVLLTFASTAMSKVELKCEDSDGGKKSVVRGFTTQTIVAGNCDLNKGCRKDQHLFRDKCANKKVLIEQFCVQSREAQSINITCENGCIQGKCQ